jgi:CRP-like cAMP-binding protein
LTYAVPAATEGSVLQKRAEGGSGAPHALAQLGLTADDLALIRRLPLFGGIDPPRLARLLASASVRLFGRNSRLFAQGEPADRFFVVLDGWVRLFRETLDGQESTIAVFGPGESLAEAAMLDAARYPVSGSVAGRARLLVVPAAGFLGEIRRDPELTLNLLASMARHLHRLVLQVEQLTSRSSVERVAGFLLHLCPPGAERAEIELPLDKSLIAARLGMQPETFSRSLARLRGDGVETAGSRVVVGDVRRLRARSGAEA